MTLTSSQQELYDRLKEDNAVAGFPFTAGLHWEWVNRLFVQWFNEDGIEDVIYQRFNDHYAGLPTPGYQKLWGDYIRLQLGYGDDITDIRHLLALLLDAKGCDLHKKIAACFGVKHTELHWDLLTASEAIFWMNQHGPVWTEGRRTVLDLGGGWGRMGCALRILNPGIKYIQCDLPESLLISSEFLPKILKEPAPLPIEQFNLDTPGIYFISAQTIMEIPDDSLDLVVNIASFQEMPREQTDAYHKIITQKSRHLYSLQYWGIPTLERFAELNEWTLLSASHPYWGERYSQGLYYVERPDSLRRRADPMGAGQYLRV